MKNKNLVAILIAGLGLACQPAALAHRMWLLPSTTVLSGKNQWISVEAAVSNNLFFPNHRPVNLTQVEVRAPDGSPVELKNSVTGQIRSSFELLLEQQGTYRIALRPSMGRRGGGPGGPGGPGGQGGPGGGAAGAAGQGDLMGSWEENGQVQRWRGTAETLVSEKMAQKPGFKLRGMGGRRVVTFVTCGEPTKDNLKPEGKDLEIDFVTHPNDLFSGEPATFRFLMDGKPAKDTQVSVVMGDDRFRNDEGEVKYTANSDGIVKIDWKQPGRYWLQATSTMTSEQHGVPMEKTSSYIVVLEVLPQ